MIQFRFCYAAGRVLAWSAQRPEPGSLRLDMVLGQFVAAPANPTRPLMPEPGIFNGRYEEPGYSCHPGELWDGDLIVAIHDLTDPANPVCLGEGLLDAENGATRQGFPLF